MEVGLVRKIDIDQEMQQAYLDYAMSVIVARALPDARDGLKPVHRRILYAMYDMGLRPAGDFKKSARIVGEVLGKYHPHSDTAVYDAMVRMAQEFTMRYPLIEGQGNFGSLDGDPPAAMRYTEARLASASADLLGDIESDTVEFERNFDDSLEEPGVLPAALPNMLVNGATGIAVGMSTSIPPHNLSEVVDALTYMLERWNKIDDINIEDLMKFIRGPDFPTGGVILQNGEKDPLTNAYGRGRGRITVQAKARVEGMSRGRSRIIISELPYMTNKASLIERIARLARDEVLEGITDLRDESDRQGMRIVIELTKKADPEAVIQELFRRTTMRGTFSIIMLALVNGEPRLLSLKQALRVFLDHRLTIGRRRTEYALNRAKTRAHILEGIRIALQDLEKVIDLIRRSRSAETARNNLMRQFKLSVEQAQAILDLPLRRLASLEQKKIETEYKELQTNIRKLQALLRSPKKMRAEIARELKFLKEAYGDPRRTQIVNLEEGETKAEVLTASDLVTEETVWVSVTPDGLISRSNRNKTPRLSGRAAPGLLLRANTRDTLYLINDQGETSAIPVHLVPVAKKLNEGVPFRDISSLIDDRPLAAMFCLPPKSQLQEEGWFVASVTRQGLVKRSAVEELPGPTARPFTLVKVNDEDQLGWVQLTNNEADYILTSAEGMAIRFSEEEVRPMGLVAAGVMGIKLKDEDQVVGFELAPKRGALFLQRSDGQAKRVNIKHFPRQGRYGQGVIAWKLPKGTRLVGSATGRPTTRITLHLKLLSAKSVRLDAAPTRTRPAQGGSVVDLKSGDEVLAVTTPWDPPRPTIKK